MACLYNFLLPFLLTNHDHDDGSSSLAVSVVTHGYFAVLSQEITCRRGMPHWSRGSAFSGIINVICICRIKLILIRGRFSTWGPLLSFSRKPSLIKWSLDNTHLAREQSVLSHCVQREGIYKNIWTQDESVMLCRVERSRAGCAADCEERGEGLLQCCWGLEVNPAVCSGWITMCRFAGIEYKDYWSSVCLAWPPAYFLGCRQGF